MDTKIKTLRERFVDVVIGCAGLPYKWGAAGPRAFDCSGLVEYAFNEIGHPQGDINSALIYEKYHGNKVLPGAAKIGSLFLYSSSRDMSRIDHVMVLARIWPDGSQVLIGARGGDSSVVSPEAAYLRGAMVDAVRGDYWTSALMMVVDPFAGV